MERGLSKFFQILRLNLFLLLFAQSFALIAQDYVIDAGDRNVFIIPDVHGDLNGLFHVLYTERLIDLEGNWTGGDNLLFSLGDLNDRVADSRGVMDLFMKLEKQAAEQSGYVEAIDGNHESLVAEGNFEHIPLEEHSRFENLAKTKDELGTEVAYRGDSKYAKWLQKRRSIVKINTASGKNHILVHAGFARWALNTSFSEINSGVQEWIKHLQGQGPEPDEDTYWMVDNDGPLWTRSMAISENQSPADRRGLSKKELEEVLKRENATSLIVGHTPTIRKNRGFRIVRQTRKYGRRFVMADTGFSDQNSGRLSSIRIHEGRLIPRYYRRPTTRYDYTKQFQENCALSLEQLNELKTKLRKRKLSFSFE